MTHDRLMSLSVRSEHRPSGEQPRDTTVDFSAPEDVPDILKKHRADVSVESVRNAPASLLLEQYVSD